MVERTFGVLGLNLAALPSWGVGFAVVLGCFDPPVGYGGGVYIKEKIQTGSDAGCVY